MLTLLAAFQDAWDGCADMTKALCPTMTKEQYQTIYQALADSEGLKPIDRLVCYATWVEFTDGTDRGLLKLTVMDDLLAQPLVPTPVETRTPMRMATLPIRDAQEMTPRARNGQERRLAKALGL